MATLTQRVWRALRAIPDMAEGSSVFADDDTVRAFYVDGTQVVNLLDDEIFEVRVTRKVISAHRARLKADSRVELRRGTSDWITVRAGSPRDIPFLVELGELAAAAHRPPAGVTSRPPPEGAALARRRRFH